MPTNIPVSQVPDNSSHSVTSVSNEMFSLLRVIDTRYTGTIFVPWTPITLAILIGINPRARAVPLVITEFVAPVSHIPLVLIFAPDLGLDMKNREKAPPKKGGVCG